MLTKVYTNTLMMLINNRARMRSMLMRGDTAGLGGPLQWVIDTSNVDGTSRSAPREQHELVSFKTPVIEAYPDIDSPIDERGKLVVPGGSRAGTPRSSDRAATPRGSVRVPTPRGSERAASPRGSDRAASPRASDSLAILTTPRGSVRIATPRGEWRRTHLAAMWLKGGYRQLTYVKKSLIINCSYST